MFKIFKISKIFLITSKAPKYVMVLFVIVLSIGLLEALIFSPEDYKQSHSVRIMYVHVPAAWISLGIFSSMTFLGLTLTSFLTSLSLLFLMASFVAIMFSFQFITFIDIFKKFTN